MTIPERRKALQDHANGAVLVNVMVLTEGWDSPMTSCCILARGCGSVGTYLQIVGRILRPAPGKHEALLIDLTGRSYHSHGPPDEDREYSLEGKGIRRKDKTEETFCQVCGTPVEEYPCSKCGFDPTGSRYENPNYTGDRLAERYARKRTEDDETRAKNLSRWLAEARAKGWKFWSAHKKFEAVYGVKPSAEIIASARLLSSNVVCSNCSKCSKPTAKLYGNMCGNCYFGRRING
jgi:superfamily II DNA or RNA helicase